ncbi:MAG TPA: Na+/H+ antiporter subunit E [Candidatus Altiarchaeales archaeon]|nr:Na+/H+ antiporter subunit E [Candidatus Altiarchaeales archaeon]
MIYNYKLIIVMNVRNNIDIGRFLLTAVFLFTFWMLLSWELSFMNIVSGILGCLIVSYISYDLLIRGNIHFSLRKTYLLSSYLLYLACEIVKANADVAKRVLDPRMPINPRIIEFKTKLTSDGAKTILANSITLTPGTITIDVIGDRFYVHALSPEFAESLLKGTMENKLFEIFG